MQPYLAGLNTLTFLRREDSIVEKKEDFPLYVTFIWNQHQPVYKDLQTGDYHLPWVRLHSVKAYYPMADFLNDYQRAKAVFNLSPSLLCQLLDYKNGKRDYYFQLSEKSASKLTGEDKDFILKNFFVNPRVAKESEEPAFVRLRQLKEQSEKDPSVFTSPDWRDIQTLHNLAWINPALVERDESLREILKKPGGYAQKEKSCVLDYHISIVSRVIDVYKKAREEGRAELITSPYYHPIMPLLIDSDAGAHSRPGLVSPENRYNYPEDASYQLEKAKRLYFDLFKSNPIGLWPAEQAMSREMIPVCSKQKIKWVVTDESVLESTLKIKLRGAYRSPMENVDNRIYVTGSASEELLHPNYLYQPFRVKMEDCALVVFFRDQFLSDLIGFYYANMGGEAAARDLTARLESIRVSLEDRKKPYLVTIALDGENCWEHYPDDSYKFFETLYSCFEERSDMELITPQDYLSQYGARHTLPALATGSWNKGTLERWIGTPGKNRAWDYLFKVRKDLAEMTESGDGNYSDAWESFYMAQGSDYFWWFDSMPSDLARPFEEIFRTHLAGVYLHLGQKVPDFLKKSVLDT